MKKDEAKQNLDYRIHSKDFLAVELKSTHKVIGNLYFAFKNLDTYELGYVFNSKFWGKGYAYEASKALINEAFSHGVHRISANCDVLNKKSWSLLERLGFIRSGYIEKNVYFWLDKEGKPIWKDTYIYSLLGEKQNLQESTMRRSKQALEYNESYEILKRNSNGVLALCVGNAPYGVPLNYCVEDNNIYFHGAPVGKKIDMIKVNNNVTFTVVDQDKIVKEEFTSYFRSVVVYGKAEILTNEVELKNALTLIGRKYGVDDKDRLDNEVNSSLNRVAIIRLKIDKITGKQAIELLMGK